MFVVLLRFSRNKTNAAQFMPGHKAWIQRGFEDGVFLLTGNLEPGTGGGILANDHSLADLQARVNDDPFVAEDVVRAEIIEITPGRTDERLTFLLSRPPQAQEARL